MRLSVSCLAAALVGLAQCLGPQVVLEGGTVRGYYDTSLSGRRIAAFQGIPYAKPPVGRHRFKESIAMGPWLGVYNATTAPNLCLQYSHLGYQVIGSEDCLYLNVFTPQYVLQLETGEAPLDVVVFIHGGAFMFFSSLEYRPHFLLDKDVVLVTFNYRLGPLGFLSTGDTTVPGNNGMKDQVLALKWVRRNIAAFGGDPARVTIAGMSAGGASVHYHMVSPLSAGLFHKAISMSGVALNPWSYAEDLGAKTQTLAATLGCSFKDSQLLIKCLRSRPAEQIVQVSSHMQSWLYLPISPWAPSLEPAGPSAFLAEPPLQIILEGRAHDVPWLTSFTSHEGLYPSSEFIFDDKLLEDLTARWHQVMPDLLEYAYTAPPEKINEITDNITQFYLKSKTLRNVDEQIKFVELVGDRMFVDGISEAALVQAKKYKSPVHAYRFSYHGNQSISQLMCHCNQRLGGACHGDDTGYVFNTDAPKPSSATDMKMVASMVQLWYRYITTGEAEWSGSSWPAVQEGLPDLTYLDISGPVSSALVRESDTGHRTFWRSLALDENHYFSPSPSIKEEL